LLPSSTPKIQAKTPKSQVKERRGEKRRGKEKRRGEGLYNPNPNPRF